MQLTTIGAAGFKKYGSSLSLPTEYFKSNANKALAMSLEEKSCSVKRGFGIA